MIAELKSLNVELMVSIWPTVDRNSENFEEMFTKGLLVRQDRGVRVSMLGEGNPIHFDATNPAARTYVWNKVKQNYYDRGIRVFWLDEAEPEYTVYDFDIYRYYLGSNLSIGNRYPVDYSRAFYEGMQAQNQSNIVNLVRCAWAGSQAYGALVWSGDIASSWSSFRDQLAAGLNMGMAGLSWFTTDIGGFHGGHPDDPEFRELFVRWLQWATFCPVMRLHGDREPRQKPIGTSGGAWCASGGPNEVWSYGEEVLKICTKYLNIREEMRDYTRSLMKAAHDYGDPVMAPCFYHFPDDDGAWRQEDQYMYGPDILCAPILMPGQRKRQVYLPGGETWIANDGTKYDGRQVVTVDCPLDTMPVFRRQR